MKFSAFVVIAMVLLSFGGCLINQNLSAMHVDETAAKGLFADVCAPEGSDVFDCKVVMKSKWAVWPPNEPDPVTGKQMGIPIALLGWAYFTGVCLWFVVVGRCDYSRRFWHYLFLLGIIGGCCVSAFFLYILFFGGLEAKCLWCIISHAINFLLLVGTVMLIPRKPKVQPTPQVAPITPVDGAAMGEIPVPVAQESPEAADATLGHPVPRLVLATLIGALALAWGEYSVVSARASQVAASQYEKVTQQQQMVIDEFYQDTEALVQRFEAEENIVIEHRPDDPMKGDGELLLPMVIFSDLQCPACRVFDGQLMKDIVPEFNGMLRIYWKHLPLNTDCNPYISRNLHPQACTAAYAAEAARILGGNDAFWDAHDRIYKDQRKLANFDYRQLATDLKLDPDKFIEAMNSDEAKERVKEDVELANKLGIKSTPYIYLWNRKVDRRMLMNSGFVERINKGFEQQRKKTLLMRKLSTPSPTPEPAGSDEKK